MKIKYFEFICMYLPIFIVCILFGTFARISVISKGGDEFTGNIAFGIVIGLGFVVYAGITLFFNGIYDIVRRFVYIRVQQLPKIFGATEQTDVNQLRVEKRQELKNQKDVKRDLAINYTRSQFLPYVNDDDLLHLCNYVVLYSEGEKLIDIKPIKVEKLTNTDLYHFGWNLWKHFRHSKQDEIALFLKVVFAYALKDVEQDSIKRHLKDDERKGIIVIEHTIEHY